jgi:hypothetical protein
MLESLTLMSVEDRQAHRTEALRTLLHERI